MKGLLILTNNYSYEGTIAHNEPHGYGVFRYANTHIYTGQCMLGKPDGYGCYQFNATTNYTGYFSMGKFHGIGTYQNDKIICKGTWRLDKKHGYFFRTNKEIRQTARQLWIDDVLKEEEFSEFLPEELMQTSKANPAVSKKQNQRIYHGTDKKCIACFENSVNATNSNCGHVCMCFECLIRCEKCPICRSPLEQVIKLYVS